MSLLKQDMTRNYSILLRFDILFEILISNAFGLLVVKNLANIEISSTTRVLSLR